MVPVEPVGGDGVAGTMKILCVTKQFGRSYQQGTERYIRTLTHCLRGRGHEVAVLGGDPLALSGRTTLGDVVEDDEDEIHHYPIRGWMAVMGLPARRLATWIADHGPDLVHVTNPAHVGIGAMAACRRLGIAVVVTTMDFWWVCPKSTLLRADGSLCDGTPPWHGCIRCACESHARARLNFPVRPPRVLAPLAMAPYVVQGFLRGMSPGDVPRWVRRRTLLSKCLDATDHVIFPSRATRDAIGAQLGHDRWRLVPYGLHETWFERPRTPASALIPPEDFRIGFAGALLPHKGPHLLLEAAKQLGWHRSPIALAGGFAPGGYETTLRRAAEGLNVTFEGWIPSPRMPEFLRGLDVLALPSLWPENLPFSMLEAHAAGVPVVAADVAGVSDQVTDARLRFEPGSVEGLAAALEFVRQSPGEIATPTVHTAEQMTDATLAVYEQALAHAAGGRRGKGDP